MIHKESISEYAKVKLEFTRSNNINESIQAYADFYEVHFNYLNEFVDFFNINKGTGNRDLFVDFSKIFLTFIPKSMRKARFNSTTPRFKMRGKQS